MGRRFQASFVRSSLFIPKTESKRHDSTTDACVSESGCASDRGVWVPFDMGVARGSDSTDSDSYDVYKDARYDLRNNERVLVCLRGG